MCISEKKITSLKSSFDKAKYIFDQGIWECNGHFDHWVILRVFCVAYGIHAKRNFYSLGLSSDLVSGVPLIDEWSMTEILWQHIHDKINSWKGINFLYTFNLGKIFKSVPEDSLVVTKKNIGKKYNFWPRLQRLKVHGLV